MILSPQMDPDSPFPPGTVILNKYVVEGVLGEGGMGTVLRARHQRLGEPVALKILHPRWASNPTIVARFEREARASLRIKSEHVARVTDVETLESGAPLMVMEMLEGRDLAEELQNRFLSIQEVVDYLLQACLALAEAHSIGLVHRDLKPSNLFLTRRADGSTLLKVLDFGIAKALPLMDGDAGLTETQDVIGSPLYMSPEQIRSSKHVDQRADIWALGVIFYEMLTGDVPFDGEASSAILAAIAADPPRALSPETTTPERELVLARTLSKVPAERFANVGELAEALGHLAPGNEVMVRRIQAVTGTTSVETRPSGVAQKNAEAARSGGSTTEGLTVLGEATAYQVPQRKTWALPAAILGVLLLVGFAFLLRGGSSEEPKPPTTASTPAPKQLADAPMALQEAGITNHDEPTKSAVLPAPTPSSEPKDLPVSTGSVATQARPRSLPRAPTPAPAPVRSLVDEATESRK